MGIMRHLSPRFPRRGGIGIAAIAFLASLPACSHDDDPAATAVELREAILFQTDEPLHGVRDIAVDDSGRVWVLTGLDPFLRVYSPDGKLLRRFGRRGRGPGEMMNPWSIFLTRDASAPAGVWDVAMRRLVLYSRDGRPTVTHGIDVIPSVVRSDMPEITYGSVDVLRAWGDGFVLQDTPSGVIRPSHILYSRLLRLDGKGKTVATVADFHQRFKREIGGLGTATTMVPLPLWTTCSGSDLVFLDPFAQALVWIDAAGRQDASTPLRLPRRRIQEHDRRRYLTHVIELDLHDRNVGPDFVQSAVAKALRMGRKQFPPMAPPAVDVLCDSHGQVWLQQFSTQDHPLGYGREWMVVGRSGKSRWFRFPPGFQPRAFTRSAVIGVQTDSLDVQQVAKVVLPRGRDSTPVTRLPEPR
ncbi:MAG TPA: hypothetical protein VFS20_20585 [Longimicrobium sp.]|nr:hypothetical protein [Longimicrobium sp.]